MRAAVSPTLRRQSCVSGQRTNSRASRIRVRLGRADLTAGARGGDLDSVESPTSAGEASPQVDGVEAQRLRHLTNQPATRLSFDIPLRSLQTEPVANSIQNGTQSYSVRCWRGRLPMRILLAIACAIFSIGTASADQADLVTAPNAILCMSADSLETATAPPVAKSQVVLQAMGCLRSEAGIRTRMVQAAPGGLWQVRFYPVGISGGVVLWGRESAFVPADGSQARASTRPLVAVRTNQ
jgi:hypothetical protein